MTTRPRARSAAPPGPVSVPSSTPHRAGHHHELDADLSGRIVEPEPARLGQLRPPGRCWSTRAEQAARPATEPACLDSSWCRGWWPCQVRFLPLRAGAMTGRGRRLVMRGLLGHLVPTDPLADFRPGLPAQALRSGLDRFAQHGELLDSVMLPARRNQPPAITVGQSDDVVQIQGNGPPPSPVVPDDRADPVEADRARLVTIPDRVCLLYTSPSPRDRQKSRMPSSA